MKKKVLEVNFTQIPNILFDDWLPELEKGELKVLLYVMRRTYGFGKQKDIIAFSQLLNGISNKEGLVLDKGTGLGKETLTRSIKKLEEKEILIVSREGRTNSYSLNLNYTSTIIELVPQSNLSSTIIEPKSVPQSNTQKKGKESKQNKEGEIEIKERFDVFRKLYKKVLKGKTRGLDTEYNNFKKKYPSLNNIDSIRTIELLLEKYYKELNNQVSSGKENAFEFVPLFQTYINQARWEHYQD